MKCRFCGEEFEPNKRGVKTDFCKREECKKQRKKEVQRQYLERKKSIAAPVVMKVEENNSIEEYKNNVVCNKVSTDSYGDIIEKARELGTIRYELVTALISLKEKISKTDKIEQDLLHMIENVEELTAEGAIDISIKIKKNRNQRREYKDRYFLLSSLTNGIIIKNPERYIRKGIEMVRNQTYNYKILEDMMEKSKDIEKDGEEE